MQFAPIAATLSAASAATAARGSSPPRVRPSSPKVSWAMTGRSHSASATAAACESDSASPKVSRMMRSTQLARAAICSRMIGSRSACAMGDAAALITGPTLPATSAAEPDCRTASRARRAPAMLISATLSCRPTRASRSRLASKVFVCTMSAPAARYAACRSRTRSGLARLSSDRDRSSGTPAECSMVPIAPSHTSTRLPSRRSVAGPESGCRSVSIRHHQRATARPGQPGIVLSGYQTDLVASSSPKRQTGLTQSTRRRQAGQGLRRNICETSR